MPDPVDMRQIVLESFEKVVTSGFVEDKIKEQIEKTVASIVEDELRSWSEFGKLMKEAIRKSLKFNTDELTLPEYNVFVLNAIKESVDRVIAGIGVDTIKKEVEELLAGLTETEFKLSDLVKEFKEEYQQSGYYDGEREMSFHIEKHEMLSFIRFDGRENKESYRCKVNLVINNDTQTVNSFKIDDQDLTKINSCGNMYAWERKLFQIYAQGIKVICDDDNVYTYYDQED
jgi:outer membrane protein assembly factor BamA